MAPEGVVNALSRIHKALVPGGVLLDLHPTVPFATAEAGGATLGRFDEREFVATVRATEAGMEEAVRIGLFEQERELRFDVLDRFEDADELLETVAEWDGFHIPKALARRIRAAPVPIDIRERVVLRRLRALEPDDAGAR
jgi:hypothetical protein